MHVFNLNKFILCQFTLPSSAIAELSFPCTRLNARYYQYYTFFKIKYFIWFDSNFPDFCKHFSYVHCLFTLPLLWITCSYFLLSLIIFVEALYISWILIHICYVCFTYLSQSVNYLLTFLYEFFHQTETIGFDKVSLSFLKIVLVLLYFPDKVVPTPRL